MVKNNQLRVINKNLHNDQYCSIFNSFMTEVPITPKLNNRDLHHERVNTREDA